jgi:hypothetical protein
VGPYCLVITRTPGEDESMTTDVYIKKVTKLVNSKLKKDFIDKYGKFEKVLDNGVYYLGITVNNHYVYFTPSGNYHVVV